MDITTEYCGSSMPHNPHSIHTPGYHSHRNSHAHGASSR
jgi:hypothetical protein